MVLMAAFNVFPFLLFLYFTRESRESVETLFNKNLSENSIAWLSANNLLVFLSTLLFLAIYNLLPKIANAIAKKSGSLKREDVLILKEAFEDIVGIKSDRIEGECEAFLAYGNNAEASTVFKSITQPDQQIYFTVNTVWKFFEKIAGNVSFDVRLAEIGAQGELLSWYTHGGEPPTHEISELDCPDSAVRHCVATKSVVVIPGIQREA
jgi:hypothetical protein